MADQVPAVVEPFDINKSPRPGFPGARLPSLGKDGAEMEIGRRLGVSGVESYLAVMHGIIQDNRGSFESSLAVAAKALGTMPPQAQTFARLSFMPDPANAGLIQWPGFQPESLMKVAQENLLPQMIIRSRVNDLRRFCSLSTHPWSPGWKVVMREAEATPSKADEKAIHECENFIWNCSRDNVFSDVRERDAGQISPFEQFITSAADDSLTYDGWAIWTDMDRAGRVRKFTNLPAAGIRLADPRKGYQGNPRNFAALVDETGSPVTALTRDEMTWCVRNVRTNPAVAGYGWSEIEMAVRLVQGYQAAIDLNVDTFQKSSVPNGIIMLEGDFWNQDQVDALQREWTNMKRGVSKMWGLPVISIPEGGKISLMDFMDIKGIDVRYKDHMNMMVGAYCIISQYPIKRLGLFASGNHRDNQPTADESTEIQGVDDPGLPALLMFMEHKVNEYLVQPNWPHLRMTFMAKNPKEDARSYEALKLARTWKESRAEADLPELPTIGPSWAKPMMEIMEACPEDSAKMGVFQTLAQVMLTEHLGINDKETAGAAGGGPKTPGAPFPSKKDPAASQAHGHRSGVRRSASTNA